MGTSGDRSGDGNVAA